MGLLYLYQSGNYQQLEDATTKPKEHSASTPPPPHLTFRKECHSFANQTALLIRITVTEQTQHLSGTQPLHSAKKCIHYCVWL